MNPDLTERQQDKVKLYEQQQDPMDSAGEDSETEKPARRSGRRKIKIEYIEDKNRRHITFSKRKAGIMKKAYELSTLTGTQVLLLVVSETGLVYTFTTVKLQPIVTKPEGKNLIQACLNAPDPLSAEPSAGDASYTDSPRVEEKKPEKVDPPVISAPQPAPPPQQQQQQPYNTGYGNQTYPPPANNNYPNYNMAPTANPNNSGSGNNAPGGQAPQAYGQSPQQQPQQPYGQMAPQPGFYGNGQPHYMPHPQQQQQQQQQPGGYWQQGGAPRQDPMIKDEGRRNAKC